MRKFLSIAAVLLLLAMTLCILASCGGEDDKTTSPAAKTSEPASQPATETPTGPATEPHLEAGSAGTPDEIPW